MKERATRTTTRPRVRLATSERREQLLAVGLRAFTTQSYDAVSTAALAAEAGISHGLLFHYFPCKHDYYLAVLQAAADALLGRVLAAATGEAPAAARLVAGLDAYFGFVAERAEAYATLLRGGVGADATAQEIVEATRRRFVDAIAAQLVALVGPPPAPHLARAALRGWIGLVEALALDWVERRDLRREELVELAARGLALAAPEAAGLLAAR